MTGVLILLLASCILLFTPSAFAQTYNRETAVETLTSAGKQEGVLYGVTGAFGQFAPASSLNSSGSSNQIYPGYVPNLNTRIIVEYDLEIEDTTEDKDSDASTQVAGVYFPLRITAKDAFGYAVRSDSGTALNLVTNKDSLKLDTDSDLDFDDIRLTLSKGTCPDFQGYSLESGSSLWLKLIDGRNLASNIILLNIKPAWISRYSITASSPQRQANFWHESISALDAYGNVVSDISHLTAHPSATVTLGLAEGYTGRAADDPLKFYINTTDTGGNPLAFSYASNNTSVYLKDNQAETVELGLTAMIYEYGIGNYASLSAVEKSFISEPIQILGTGYEVMTDFKYDQDNNILYVSAWLEKDGSIVSPSDDGSGLVTIYDSDGNSLKELSGDTAAATGIYHLQWSTQLLQTNYLARVELTHEGVVYQEELSFIVEPDIILTQEITEVLKTKLSEAETAIQQAPESATETIIGTEAIEAIDSGLGRVLVATESSIPERLGTLGAEELAPLAAAGIVNTSTVVQRGGELVVNFQTYPAVLPLIDVYDPDGGLFISKQVMEALLEEEGFYQATITFGTGSREGNYTLVCSELTHGTMDALSVMVVEKTLEGLGKDSSSIIGAVGSVPNISNINIGLQETFDMLEMEMLEIFSEIVFVSKQTVSSILRTDVLSQRNRSLLEVFNGLKELRAGLEESYLFPAEMIDDVFSLNEDEALDINYLQTKISAAGALLRMTQSILDKLIYEPVQEYWFEFR